METSFKTARILTMPTIEAIRDNVKEEAAHMFTSIFFVLRTAKTTVAIKNTPEIYVIIIELNPVGSYKSISDQLLY